MKILIISKLFPPESSAQAIQLSRVTEAIANHENCEVAVLAGLEQKDKPTGFGCPVHYVGYKKWSSTVNLGILKWVKTWIKNLNRNAMWVKLATQAGLEIVESYKPDIILSASMPLCCHQVAMQLHRKRNTPWIAFFSDIIPEFLSPHPYTKKVKITNFLWFIKEYQITKRCMKESDAIIMTNKLAIEYMSDKFSLDIAQKSFVTPHIGKPVQFDNNEHIDSELLNGRIVHVGLMDNARVCPELVEAVRIAHKNMPDKFKGLLLVGHVSEKFMGLIHEKERGSLFVFVGTVKPSLANEYVKRAESLLLVEADMKINPYLPSKIAEYAVNGRNIIAITPLKSTVREYIDKFGGGCCVSHNVGEIADAICRVMNSSHSGSENRLAEIFSSEYVADRYYEVFEKVLR